MNLDYQTILDYDKSFIVDHNLKNILHIKIDVLSTNDKNTIRIRH